MINGIIDVRKKNDQRLSQEVIIELKLEDSIAASKVRSTVVVVIGKSYLMYQKVLNATWSVVLGDDKKKSRLTKTW